MKYVNFYTGIALMLIVSLAGSLGATTGKLAPSLIVGALLLTVLVLGWAGGASDARHEVDRLTRLESGRQLLTQSHIKQRDQLEAALARLQHRIEEVTASNAGLRKVAERWADEVGNLRDQVKDGQAAIELFTANHAKNMVRITALEGENAELRKRPSSDVMMATAQRLIAELNNEPGNVDEDCRNCQARGIGYLHSELLRHMAEPVVSTDQIEQNDSQARIDSGAEVVADQAAPAATDQGNTEIPLSAAEPALWHDGSTHPAKNGWYERQFTDGIFLQWWNGSTWAASRGGQSHWRQVGSYVCWRDVMVEPGVPKQGDAGLPVPGYIWKNLTCKNRQAGPDAPTADLCAAVGKLIKAKGRFHTEQNYRSLVLAYDAAIAANKVTGPSGAPASDWLNILAMQPLVEPVYIGKALMAHREARVVLDGGTGPKAAVFLVNISLTSWTYTKETAEAYTHGWNSGVRALRGALTEAVVGKLLPVALGDNLAGSASTPAATGAPS